ncbi:hypothetical protein EJ06DRAFT_528333 [Trichodelitschia bisporula]|uniref:Beta-hexosaminidase n=1 Tax=Trichodelitschia bisporula TaxID=703511 RepID=A0A6G1I1M4_9PEZI|nr:hypothetical protein EJ06DRAFT_528333 [Trichodelitschia bisporula]
MHLSHFLLFTPLVSAIWPLPRTLTTGTSTLWISRNVAVKYGSAGASISSSFPASPNISSQAGPPTGADIVHTALLRANNALFKTNFVPWMLHPRGSVFEPGADDGSGPQVTELCLQLPGDTAAALSTPPPPDADESYNLTLTVDGTVTIAAQTALGLSHGLSSLTQLFYSHSSSGGVYTPLAPVTIVDGPVFPHRGLNLDLSRSYFPKEDLYRVLDALSLVKMNRFHLHITDSQSWPLVIPSLPDLAAKGATRPDWVYTPEDLAAVQDYGARRGVMVYLETDMPGHTASIYQAYPELVAAYDVRPNWDTYAAEPPSGTLKLNSSKVEAFLDTLFADLLPRVKPWTSIYHTGGDEVNEKAYGLDDSVKSSDKSVLQPLMQKFVDGLHKRVRGAGLTPVVWEEMLLVWNLTLGPDVIVQAWQGETAVAAITAAGHKALVGSSTVWYLDCGHGQWLSFTPQTSAQFYPYADYCSPRHNWKVIYAHDPLAHIPADQHHLVQGGEVHLWAEQTDRQNLDTMLWPRAAAAAEVLWAGAKDELGQNRSQVEAAPRLAEVRERLVAGGVRAEPVQMVWCLRERGCVL